jgi:hypothetical protein
MVGAVIDVRVSTTERTENLILPTQLRTCEEYCRRQGSEVLEPFHEEGESATSTDLSQLQNLLTFCRLDKGRVHYLREIRTENEGGGPDFPQMEPGGALAPGRQSVFRRRRRSEFNLFSHKKTFLINHLQSASV